MNARSMALGLALAGLGALAAVPGCSGGCGEPPAEAPRPSAEGRAGSQSSSGKSVDLPGSRFDTAKASSLPQKAAAQAQDVAAESQTAGPGGSESPLAATVAAVEKGNLTADGRAASPGDSLPEKSLLRVSAGGRAAVRIGGEGVLLLEGPCTLRLDLARRGLRLASGRVLSAWRRLTRPFFARAPNMVLAVRGTDFFLETRGDGQTYLCVCAGTVEVETPRGRKVGALSGTHHSSYLILTEDKSTKALGAPMEAHSDEDLAWLKSFAAKL